MKHSHTLKGLLLTAALGIAATFTTTAFAAETWDYTTSKNADGNICLSFTDFQLVLPASWSGKCRMGTNPESTVLSIYHGASRDAWTKELGYSNGGTMFSILCDPDYDIESDPESYYLGEGTMGSYYFTQPTDYQGYVDDSAVSNEYASMSRDVAWIRSNIRITNPGASTTHNISDADYIFPHSSDSYLTEADLAGMDYDEIQMAINEIYARHHRLFQLPQVQAYFNARSWYVGTIPASDFDPNVMNAFEGANIDLMVKQLERLSAGASSQPQTQTHANTKTVSGKIIETGSDFFRVRFADGSTIQFWYEHSKVSYSSLWVNANVTLTYDTDTYEAFDVITR